MLSFSRRALIKTAGAGALASFVPLPEHEALAAAPRPRKWAAFYGMKIDESTLVDYDTIVLDPMFEGSIETIASGGAKVCAYLSVGEIRSADAFFPFVDPAALLAENAAWPGTWRVDVRRDSWRNALLDRMIPFAVTRGFTGLMLDTIDTPPYLEQSDPQNAKGMRKAAVDLLLEIRSRFPQLRLILNRGYDLLPDLIGSFDALIAESLLTQPEGDGYKRVEPAVVALQLDLLQPLRVSRPDVPVLSLDYWFPDDLETIREIYGRERALGHHPYVATRLLDRVVPEPQG